MPRGAASTDGDLFTSGARAGAPSDTGVRFDLAVVLQWAGRSREATDVFEGMQATEAPEYVLPR